MNEHTNKPTIAAAIAQSYHWGKLESLYTARCAVAVSGRAASYCFNKKELVDYDSRLPQLIDYLWLRKSRSNHDISGKIISLSAAYWRGDVTTFIAPEGTVLPVKDMVRFVCTTGCATACVEWHLYVLSATTSGIPFVLDTQFMAWKAPTAWLDQVASGWRDRLVVASELGYANAVLATYVLTVPSSSPSIALPALHLE